MRLKFFLFALELLFLSLESLRLFSKIDEAFQRREVRLLRQLQRVVRLKEQDLNVAT